LQPTGKRKKTRREKYSPKKKEFRGLRGGIGERKTTMFAQKRWKDRTAGRTLILSRSRSISKKRRKEREQFSSRVLGEGWTSRRSITNGKKNGGDFKQMRRSKFGIDADREKKGGRLGGNVGIRSVFCTEVRRGGRQGYGGETGGKHSRPGSNPGRGK